MKTLEVLEQVLRGKRLADSSRRHYKDALSSLSRYSEDWPVKGVVVDEWLASLTNYGDVSIRNWYNFVNAAGKYMEKISGKNGNGVSKVPNPCETATRPRVAKKRRRYFSVGELVQIIKSCRFEQDRALVLTLIDSTARVGELVGLTPSKIGDGWIDVKGKTGERRYRLDSQICAKLREIAGGENEPVFKSKYGGFANVSSLKHRVTRVIKSAGITGSKLGPHTLRHSGASLVAQETGSALAVKALLQHDNIDTSMEYIHDAEDLIQQRISPLRLVGERVFGDGAFGAGAEQKQISMVAGADVLEADVVSTDVVVDLLEEQFAEVDDGVEVRPLLKTEDLRLVRMAFIGFIRSGEAGSSEVAMRYLLKRMLRKVKGA